MILLLAFAFLAGIITVLSPCILPILPIILSSSVGGESTGRSRPLGVVIGFILSFTFFTLFLTGIVRLIGIPADTLRLLSVFIIALFGFSLLIPQFQVALERLFSKLASHMPNSGSRRGFPGGLIIGLSVGLLWTPCVGPILASVISLALTGEVTFDAFLITLAYSIGTAIPMFLIILGGQTALKRVPWLTQNLNLIQKIFGVFMILTAIAIFFNVDRKFQTYILNTFPSYGTGLTSIEDNKSIIQELDNISDKNNPDNKSDSSTDNLLNMKGPVAPEIIPGGQWFNSDSLTLEGLRGKVVLIDFWTYSCINCQRTLPYLVDWNSKYKDKGLVIIGVHSPEFEFEKNPENVMESIEYFKIDYPVVQDNDFATWRAYSNRYWPAKYFIDKDGIVRFTHFGEGAYDESEKMIQDLLKETGAEDVSMDINNPNYSNYSSTHETYLGYSRIENFASPEGVVEDKKTAYTLPDVLSNGQFGYEGNWLISKEYSAPDKNSSLTLSFDAKEVYLVMRPKGDNPGNVRVSVDNKLQYFGEDNLNGIVTVDSDTLYKIVKLDKPGRHLLRLDFMDSNVEIFAFTFG